MNQPSNDTGEIEQAVLELELLATEHPALAAHLNALKQLLPPLYAKSVKEQPPALTRERALSKLTHGTPLLRNEPMDIDLRRFRRRWRAVCSAVDQQRQNSDVSKLNSALNRNQLDPIQLVRHLLDGQIDALYAQATKNQFEPDLTSTVLRLALFPVLCRFDRELESLRKDFEWQRGYCPTCGSWPLLGEYRGGARRTFRFWSGGFCVGTCARGAARTADPE